MWCIKLYLEVKKKIIINLSLLLIYRTYFSKERLIYNTTNESFKILKSIIEQRWKNNEKGLYTIYCHMVFIFSEQEMKIQL